MGKKHFCIPQNSSKTKKNKFYQYLYTYFHISGHSALEAGHLNDQAANISCPFLSESINFHAEWALKAPILLILACNMVFLIYIMAVSIIYYYIAATLWVITSGDASTTIRVLLSALRNFVWNLLILGYYDYYMSRLAKVLSYLTTLRPAFHDGYIAF